MWPYSGSQNNSLNRSSFNTGDSLTQSPLGSELNTGERLLWSGQSRDGLRLQPADGCLIPFALVWCGFTFFWEAIAIIGFFSGHTTGFIRYIFPLWGLPFIAIGLYLLIGRFFVDAKKRSKTWYGVTDRRVLFVTDSRERKVRSIFLQDIPKLEMVTRPDGSGTLVFGPVGNYKTGYISPYDAPAFQMIEDVRSVYNIAQGARDRARP